MPVTAKGLERRRNYLGASDMAAVLGVSPYKNAADVYLDKTADLEPWQGNEATHLGNVLEDVLLKDAAERLGVKIRRNVFRVHANKVHAATLDGWIAGENAVVEAKTAGLLNPAHRGEQWGDEGTDEIPETYLIQTQHQLFVTGAQRAYVPALIGGRGFCMFKVERNEDVIAVIERRGLAFWQKAVLPRVPPPDEVPNLDVLKRLRREPESTAQIDPDLFATYHWASEEAKGAQQRLEQAKAELIAALGTAEAGMSSLGSVTYLEQTRRTLDSKALRSEHPELAARFETESRHRVFRFKKAKGV